MTVASRRDGETLGAAMFLAGAPLVHLAKGEPQRAALSVAIRTLAFLAAVATEPDCAGCQGFQPEYVIGPLLFVVASAVDAIFVARH